MSEKRILVLFYSYSNQTRNILKKLIVGLEKNDITVVQERLQPVTRIAFPPGSIPATVLMMAMTFFRKRYLAKPLDSKVFSQWDLIILAGPTWSLQPSGVVLSMLDCEGKRLFANQDVLPIISCRGFWRAHFFGLRSLLKKCGAKTVFAPMVFNHPNPEPWNTIGVFLKLAGKMPESGKGWFRKYYPHYGHSKEQIVMAGELGRKIGRNVYNGTGVSELKFKTPVH